MKMRVLHASSPAAVLVCGLLATATAPGLTPPVAAHAAKVGPVLDAEGAASMRARTTGWPIEVASLLSETTRVVANPDGTFTADVHTGPVRYRNAAGKWTPVDLTLQRLSPSPTSATLQRPVTRSACSPTTPATPARPG